MSMFDKMSPEQLKAFNAHLELRRADGTIAKGGDEVAMDMLRILVSETGKLDPQVLARLGGPNGVDLTRSTLIPLLYDALVGPDPDLDAWLAAAGRHFEPLTYGKKESEKGSPGLYLPRMLANFKEAMNERETRPAQFKASRDEITLLTFSVLLGHIVAAAGAVRAAGPAFAATVAVDRLPKATQRRIDALARNKQFIARMGAAIEDVVAEFVALPMPERTNKQVKTSVPAGYDIERFFADRAAAKAEMREEILEEIAAWFANPPADFNPYMPYMTTDPIEKLYRTAHGGFERHHHEAEQTTAYLDTGWVGVSPEERDAHFKRMTVILPSLDPTQPADYNYIRALLISEAVFNFPQALYRKIDFTWRFVLAKIVEHARDVGPPPPNTLMAHYPLFEAAVWYCGSLPADEWPALKQWGPIGALVRSVSDDRLPRFMVAMAHHGLSAIKFT